MVLGYTLDALVAAAFAPGPGMPDEMLAKASLLDACYRRFEPTVNGRLAACEGEIVGEIEDRDLFSSVRGNTLFRHRKHPIF